jgi:hypothetical protein
MAVLHLLAERHPSTCERVGVSSVSSLASRAKCSELVALSCARHNSFQVGNVAEEGHARFSTISADEEIEPLVNYSNRRLQILKLGS